MNEIGEQVLILTRSQQEAERWCTGSVQNVPRANHTCLWHLPSTGWATIVVAHIASAGRLASATRCSRCILSWLQSITLQGMVLGLSRSCQGLGKWSFGRMQAGTPGNKVLLIELSLKRIESSERQSARDVGSSSKPHLTCFDCAFVPMYVFCVCVSPCAIVMLNLMRFNREVSDDRLLLQMTQSYSCPRTDLGGCLT